MGVVQAVAKHLNFTRAAQELSVSQPAVSRQIDSLEQYYGLQLFKRSGRSVQLTDAGKSLLGMSEHILALLDKTKIMMEGFRNLEAGSISVGASTTIGNYYLAPLVYQFKEKYPSISLSFEIQSNQKIQEKIEKNQYDVAICSGPINKSFFSEPFLIDELILISLEEIENFNDEELANETVITLGESSSIRHHIDSYFLKKGLIFKPKMEIDSIEGIKQIIINNGGISILPKRSVELELTSNRVYVVNNDNFKINRQFFIVHQKDIYPSPATLAFTAFLKKFV